MRDAGDARRHAAVDLVLRIERVQDRGRALQRVDAARRNRRVRHLAVHRDLELQAAVVRGHDLVAEAGGEQQVGLDQALLQQPAGAELAAEFLVVGEVQLDAAGEIGAERFEGAHGEGVGREVALADRRGAAVEPAVDDLAAVGIVAPSLARRDDVAVGVEGDRRAVAVASANDQVGDRSEAVLAHQRLGHRIAVDGEAEAFEQRRRRLGVRRVVARRRVGRHAHQRLQEARPPRRSARRPRRRDGRRRRCSRRCFRESRLVGDALLVGGEVVEHARERLDRQLDVVGGASTRAGCG